MSESEERFDGLLMNMAQQQRGIEPLLDTVFSFLRRKTDFFTGANASQIETTVLSSIRKHSALAEKDAYNKRQKEEEKRKQKEKLQENTQKKQKKQVQAKPKEVPRFEEIVDDASPKANTAETEQVSEDKEESALAGNGGQTDTYSWTQTLQEAQVNFPLPEGTTSKELNVVITSTKLKIVLKKGFHGRESDMVLVDGELHKKITVDDTFWLTVDGNQLSLYLQKQNQMEWWTCIIKGDAEIDTKKVQPENSKLSDLDADTRQTVEKMMFDQRQKAMGLPTSDDMNKQEMLNKFMAQHPEMDFSKAKIN